MQAARLGDVFVHPALSTALAERCGACRLSQAVREAPHSQLDFEPIPDDDAAALGETERREARAAPPLPSRGADAARSPVGRL